MASRSAWAALMNQTARTGSPCAAATAANPSKHQAIVHLLSSSREIFKPSSSRNVLQGIVGTLVEKNPTKLPF